MREFILPITIDYFSLTKKRFDPQTQWKKKKKKYTQSRDKGRDDHPRILQTAFILSEFIRAGLYIRVCRRTVCLIKNYDRVGGPMINVRKNFDAGKIFCAIEAKTWRLRLNVRKIANIPAKYFREYFYFSTTIYLNIFQQKSYKTSYKMSKVRQISIMDRDFRQIRYFWRRLKGILL